MIDYKTLFKNKNFVYLFISQVLSQLTIHVVNFLLLVSIFSKTGSAIATSFLWISYSLPAIIVGPVAATIVDYSDKRKILIFTNLIQFLTIFLYSLLSSGSIFTIYAVVFIYSFVNQFYLPAEFSVLPAIISEKKLPQANSIFFISQQLALILGFTIAGILINLVGFNRSLEISSLLMFFAFVSVNFLPSQKVKKLVSNNFEEKIVKFFRSIFFVYKYLKKEKTLIAPISLLIAINITLLIVALNLPIIADNIVGIDASYSGFVLVVPAAIGALYGAVKIPKILLKDSRKINVINKYLKILSIFFFLLFVTIPFINTPFIKVALTIIYSILMGYSFLGVYIPAQTFLQQNTPIEMRGRIFGNYWFAITIISILPIILSGTITELFGIRLFFTLLSIIFIFINIYFDKLSNIFSIKYDTN